MIHPIKLLVAQAVRVCCRMLLSVWNSEPARYMLGRVYELLRQSAHENAVRATRTRYAIAADVRWSEGTVLAGDGNIEVGQGTYLGVGCHVIAHPSVAHVRIGRGCAISHHVQIRTEGYRLDVPFSEARRLPGTWADITIGNDVWIGAGVYICAGVSIGDNTVIGANSVVTRDMPANSVCGGTPARVLRRKYGADAAT